MKIGETSNVTATINPSNVTYKNLSWISSNTSVATVSSSGVISALSAGSSVISVTTSNGLSASVNVTVTSPVGKIKLNATKFNLQKGKTISTLAIKSSSLENDPIVSVKSSKSSVLKVSLSGGKIKLKGLKTYSKYVTVTVTTQSGAKATCKVKVVKSAVKTTKLTLNATKVTLKKGASTKLTVTRNPISATDKVTYKSSNKKIATVSSSGKIVAKKKGKVTITVTSASGKKVTCKVTVK